MLTYQVEIIRNSVPCFVALTSLVEKGKALHWEWKGLLLQEKSTNDLSEVAKVYQCEG